MLSDCDWLSHTLHFECPTDMVSPEAPAARSTCCMALHLHVHGMVMSIAL